MRVNHQVVHPFVGILATLPLDLVLPPRNHPVTELKDTVHLLVEENDLLPLISLGLGFRPLNTESCKEKKLAKALKISKGIYIYI
jgi:hypothetical protein